MSATPTPNPSLDRLRRAVIQSARRRRLEGAIRDLTDLADSLGERGLAHELAAAWGRWQESREAAKGDTA